MKPILITCYVNPDIDGVAGAFAYAEFLMNAGKTCEMRVIGEVHEEARYVLDRFNIQRPIVIPNADAYNEVIIIDASDLHGLEGKIAPEKVIEIIDHRKIHEAEKFPNAKVQIELVGAAATLIAEKFMEKNIEISKESAILLYAAIISNTLNFKGAVSTDRDMRVSKWLNKTAQLPAPFISELFTAKSDLSGEKLKERIEGDFAWFIFGEKRLGIGQIEMIGGNTLIKEREAEILESLETIKKRMNLDYIFLNIIELEELKNILVADDILIKTLLEKILGLTFQGAIAETPSMLMRKQIVPLLKEELEK